MFKISDVLKQHEQLTDKDLENCRQISAEAFATAPPELTPSMEELNVVLDRYNTITDQMSRNCTILLTDSKDGYIKSDILIVDALQHDPAYFDEPQRLNEARSLVETSEVIARNFTANITKIFEETRPNEDQIIAGIVALAKDSIGATVADFESLINRTHDLSKVIREACDLIEQNIGTRYVKFASETDSAAAEAESQLKIVSEKIAGLLPPAVRILMFHLKGRITNSFFSPISS